MKQINIFQKGLTSDTDYSYQPNSTWVFPTENVRVINKRGEGFTITPINGTVKENDMKMSPGFVAIAAEEHRGIIYIVSVNKSGPKSVTELGTYPSPLEYTDTNTEFVDEYKALHNYTTVPSNAFVTSLFNYTQESKLKLIIDDGFDESANLYLCDGVNIDKVVNAGFKRNGETNGVTYTDDSFNNVLNHTPITDSPPVISSAEVVSGGSLKPGNYFIYVKYETARFDSTDYFTGINPLQVGIGSTATNTMGMADKNFTGENNRTSSALKLMFDTSSFDTAYTFIKIGIIRYYSSDSDFAQPDTWELLNDYLIEDIIIRGGELIINGREDETILSIDSIINENVREKISNDHIFLDKRIWKGGLRTSEFDNDPLEMFASLVTVSSTTAPIPDTSGFKLLNSSPGYDDEYGYQDPDKTLNELGYFGGEIYPFGIIFQLTDDTYTEAYPIQGNDGLSLAPSVDGIPGKNDKGLYRFPYAEYKEWIYPVFDFDDANNYYLLNLSFFANIKSFFVSRTDKIVNRVYSGMTTKTARAVVLTGGLITDGRNIITNTIYNPTTPPDGYSIPVFYNDGNLQGHFLPNGNKNINAVKDKWTYNNAWTREAGSPINHSSNDYCKDFKKIAVFSPDYILSHEEEINPGDNLWVRVHGKAETTNPGRYQYFYNKIIEGNLVQSSPRINMIDYQNVVSEDDSMRADCFIVDKSIHKATNFFSSFIEDGFTQSRNGWKWIISDDTFYNRSYATAPYIGLDITEGGNIVSQDDAPFERMITLYKNENNDTFFTSEVSAFSNQAKLFSIISEPFDITQKGTSRISKGDNFKMRFFVRSTRWQGLDSNSEFNWISTEPYGLQRSKRHYEYGLTLGFIADCSINIAMRNQIRAVDGFNYARYTFFPRQLLNSTFDEWCMLSRESDDAVESIQVNHGYDRVLDPKSKIGYDKTLPKDDDYKPTKIAFSAENIIEGFFNNYRVMPRTNVQYFRTDYGQIMRLAENYGELFSIRERAIMRHFVGQTKLSENITIDDDAIYLSKKELPVFYYGLRDWHALATSSTSIYGIDRTNMIIWRVVTSYTSSGSRVPQVEFLSREKFIDSEMQFIKTKLNDTPTSPVVDNGISLNFNRNYNEIMFTFLNGDYKKSLIFNEMFQVFTSMTDLAPAISTNNEDFMYVFPTKSLNKPYLYRADSNEAGSIFFDITHDNVLSIIVNGNSGEDGENNSTIFTKIFSALEIDSPQNVFKEIRYTTDTQQNTYTFTANSTEFWKHSEWAEGKWLVPVVDDTGEAEFRFVWMKVTLVFRQGKEFYIRKIISNFEISFV